MTSPPETFSSLIEKLCNVSFSKISRSFYNRLVIDDKGWTLRTSYFDKVSILLLYLFILKLFNTDRIKNFIGWVDQRVTPQTLLLTSWCTSVTCTSMSSGAEVQKLHTCLPSFQYIYLTLFLVVGTSPSHCRQAHLQKVKIKWYRHHKEASSKHRMVAFSNQRVSYWMDTQ